MILLAAGFSERMGVLNPLLPVGEGSALQRAVCLGRTERVHVISVVTGYRHEEIEAELDKLSTKNVRHIYNTNYAQGMFSSVKAGVHSLPHDIDGFLLLPVDHCAVTPSTIDKVIAAFVLSEGRAVIYPTAGGKRGHPPLIPRAFVESIREYDGPDGLRGFLSPFPSDEVEVDDAGVWLDMDTPADYAALRAHLGLPNYPDGDTCLQLMVKYGVPENIVRHSRLVLKLALKTADLLRQKGVTVNAGLLASACLLHDIARAQPDHAAAGAKLLLMEGWPETAGLVALHMDLPAGFEAGPDEPSLLYLADKLARRDGAVPLEETLAGLDARFPDDPDALQKARTRITRAQSILDLLTRRYGIGADDILRGL
jgi:CTP:molybdopterin cytidylyltransferase MocA